MTLAAAKAFLAADPQARALRPPAVNPLAGMLFRPFCERILHLDLSPAMAAIADAADGTPVTTISAPEALRLFGCPLDRLPRLRPREVWARAGGRAGKTSRMLAPKAIHAAVTTPIPGLRPGEFARSLCVAPDKDLAKQIVDYCRGYISRAPVLKAMLIDPPKDDDGEDDETKIGSIERIAFRRPSGELVEIAVKAAGRGGTGGRSRTLVAALLDEALFFRAEKSAAINDAEIYRAAAMRVVPEGQLWGVSTAWVENVGVLEEKIKENWGTHTTALVAVADTRTLNPTWDPDHRIEDVLRRTDPENADREIGAVPLAAGAETFYPEDAIARTFTRVVEELPPDPSYPHTAGVDMGFRKNSSAIVIPKAEGGRLRCAFRLELVPERGRSLKPSEVTREFAFHCMRYSVPAMFGDLHYADATREELGKLERALQDPSKADADQRAWVERVRRDPHAARGKVPVYIEWPSKFTAHGSNIDAHTEMRRRMQEGLVELPDDARMKRQARDTKKRAGSGGHVSIVLPVHGLAHGDLWGAAVIGFTEMRVDAGVVREPVRAHAAGGDEWQAPVVQAGGGGGWTRTVSEWD